MSDEKKKHGEAEIGFAKVVENDGTEFIPQDSIGTAWLGPRNDRTGKRLFRGTINLLAVPPGVMLNDSGKLNVVLFPFKSGDAYGISIQISKKHHG